MSRRHPREPLDLAQVAKDSSGPERWRLVVRALRENLWTQTRQKTEADILAIPYNGDGRQHWQAVLAEAISVFDFADVLAVHRIHDEVEADGGWVIRPRRKGDPSPVIRGEGRTQKLHFPVYEAMHVAARGGESFFIGDATSLLERRLDWLSMKRIRLRPHDAAAWLLRNPNRWHLVPISLAAYLEPKAAAKPPTQAKPKAAPAQVSVADLQIFLKRPDIAGLSRRHQQRAARDHFDPKHISVRQFRAIFRENPRPPGPQAKRR
jgi:hypothetical protein